jgi:hypothetical protein
MAKFSVTVEKQLVVSGKIEVEAKTPEEAENKVIKMMTKENLQTIDPRITWGTPAYVDCSFQTTGDVDEV